MQAFDLRLLKDPTEVPGADSWLIHAEVEDGGRAASFHFTVPCRLERLTEDYVARCVRTLLRDADPVIDQLMELAAPHSALPGMLVVELRHQPQT